MKYNEAIDMILDGGEAYMKSKPQNKFYFEDGWLDNSIGHQLRISDEYCKATDWIVEKDGVVYEECPAKALYDACKNVPWPDEPPELEEENKKNKNICPECGCALENVLGFMLCRSNACYDKRRKEEVQQASFEYNKFSSFGQNAIDEDWLEKKMLCFVRRQFAGFATFTKVKDRGCDCTDCPFCFPEEKGLLYARACSHVEGIGGIEKCHVCTPIEEKPPEKVTVEELREEFGEMFEWIVPREMRHISMNGLIYEKKRIEFFKKITYLVSLQEKE